jgi:hypothetical protein
MDRPRMSPRLVELVVGVTVV